MARAWPRCGGPGHGGRVRAAEKSILRADLVVDGIVGIGGKGGLRPEAVPLAAYAADSRAAVVAVDLPSGIEADTGEVLGTAVRADLTVTFGTHKPGLLIDPGREYAGSVRLVDIGLELPEEAEQEALQHAGRGRRGCRRREPRATSTGAASSDRGRVREVSRVLPGARRVRGLAGWGGRCGTSGPRRMP